MITAGSHSRLSVFETCKKRAELAFIHKIPEPDRGDPPRGAKEWPNDRGSRIHDETEAFVQNKTDKFPHEAKAFKAELTRAREYYLENRVFTEEMWCYNDAWQSCEWNAWDDIRFRIKTDLTIFTDDETAIIVDYKTGKRWGNEVKHAEQLQLYAVGTALRFPQIKHITTEIWYFDQDELASMEFTAPQALRFLKGWNMRNMAMMECVDFPANPNKVNCKWCPYSPRGTGHCEQGAI